MQNILIDGELYDSETGELVNEVEQVEVELIQDTLPSIVCNGGTHIQTNTEQLKKELVVYLSKFDVEVTEDNEKDCSKMATELNQLSLSLDKKRKEVSSIIKKPADDLKKAIDELMAIIQLKRTNIIEGVEVYKQKRFDLIRTLLKAKIQELYQIHKVSERYQVCNIEVLVVEGSLSKVALSKKVLESLELMVRKVKSIEDAVTIREMQLSIKCDNAGLITQIELYEVESIIEDNDYDEKLNNMIAKRVELQEQVKKQIELQEIKRQEQIKEEEIRVKAKEEIAKVQEQEKVIEKQKETGKKIVTIVATFEVEVNVNVSDMKVLAKYQDKLASEYSTLKSIGKL